MLAEFLEANRPGLIARAQARLTARSAPAPTETELENGVPLFLDQLTHALRLAETTDKKDHDSMRRSAAIHGESLQRLGLTVGQVVHDYGDVCQAITELAASTGAMIPGGEFQTLNLCLDDAIAEAVTAYASHREKALKTHESERLGRVAHELRDLVNTAMISFASIRAGRVPTNGSTGTIHARSLMAMRDLVNRSLADVRLDEGTRRTEPIAVAEFLEEVEIGAILQADDRGSVLALVVPVDRTLSVHGDRQLLAAAIANMIEQGLKRLGEGGTLTLSARTAADRVLFEVGGAGQGIPLPEGKDPEPALALAIKAAAANGGTVYRVDHEGGSVYTLDLPRQAPRRSR